MQRYVLHSHKLYSIKIIHNLYQNLSWVPCCIYFLGVNSGKSRSRQYALNGRLCLNHRIHKLLTRLDFIPILMILHTGCCMPIGDAYSSKPMVMPNFACVLMLKSVSPELVMFPNVKFTPDGKELTTPARVQTRVRVGLPRLRTLVANSVSGCTVANQNWESGQLCPVTT